MSWTSPQRIADALHVLVDQNAVKWRATVCLPMLLGLKVPGGFIRRDIDLFIA